MSTNEKTVKVIKLRFPDFCRACMEPMKPGAEAMWYGKKIGVIHLSCAIKGRKPLSLINHNLL